MYLKLSFYIELLLTNLNKNLNLNFFGFKENTFKSVSNS